MSATDVSRLQHELEWRLSEQSPEYFFEHFWKIPVVGVGAAEFKLRDYQKTILGKVEAADHIIALKARQIGMTTIVVAYAFWSAFFHGEMPWLFVSRNEDAAVKMLSRAAYGFHRLPKWMKDRGPKLVSDTQTSLVFDNGSRLESVPATGSTGRGDSVFGVVLDEFAFMEYAESIYGAVEPLVYGKMVVISTANGMGNPFHEFWLDSQRSESAWTSVFYGWDVVPSRDEHWYRERLLRYRGREWLFFQEYPASPEEAFSKSGHVAFSSEVMDYCDFREPDLLLAWRFSGELFLAEPFDDVVLSVWRLPHVERDEYGSVVQKPNYVIGVDVAEGLEHGDWTVVKVFDANTNEECAVSMSHIPVEELGEFLEFLGYWYHTALIAVERNNHGILPLDYLKKAMYPRLYRPMPAAARGMARSDLYGWQTTRKTKPKMVKDLLKALRDMHVYLHDEQFKLEAQTFVADGKGGYAATSPNHDDNVIATAIAWQAVLEQGRFPIVFNDYSVKPLTMNDVLEYDPYPVSRSGLDTPIGRRPADTVKKSIFIHPANVKQKL